MMNVRSLMPQPYAGMHDAALQRYHETGSGSFIGTPRALTGLHHNGSTVRAPPTGGDLPPLAAESRLTGFWLLRLHSMRLFYAHL